MKFTNLSNFQIQATRGYLPEHDPIQRLSNIYSPWDCALNQLPSLLKNATLGEAIKSMPLLSDTKLQEYEIGRAKLILGMLAQAYIWEPTFHNKESSPRDHLPSQIATPLIAISERLDEPPILNYADYVLRNWKAVDPNKPLTVDNLTTLATFSNRDDEKMFVVVHVAYEYVAGKSFNLGEEAMMAAEIGDLVLLTERLQQLSLILKSMKATFLSVKNIVSPDIFRNYIRLFLKGWKNNTLVSYGDIPANKMQYRGETGSQSSVIPFFDALFGIFKERLKSTTSILPPLNVMQLTAIEEYLDFRNYMPVGHRNFIHFIEESSKIRETVIVNNENTDLIDAYNQCIHGVASMRQGHKSTITPYIGKPGQLGNLGYGTGGSDYQQYLGALHSITESGKLKYSKVLS